MNVETIQMDPRIARIHYSDYLKKVRAYREERVKHAAKLEAEAKKARIPKSQQEKEDTELLSAYRALSLGQRIINIHKVIWSAGFDQWKRPNLAIARADWSEVHLKLEGTHGSFQKDSWAAGNAVRYRVPYAPHGPEFYSVYDQRMKLGWDRIKALVPAIPVNLRPAGDLSDYTILWEAEWTKLAPADPILLKQVKDSDKFFTILAQWDLTPLEQQVLEGRFS